MKLKTAWVLSALILLVALGLAQSRTKYILKVNGLTCPFCAYGLEKKLKKVKGVELVSIDLERDEATLLVKDGSVIREEVLRKAVERAGFQVAFVKRVRSETERPLPRGNEGNEKPGEMPR